MFPQVVGMPLIAPELPRIAKPFGLGLACLALLASFAANAAASQPAARSVTSSAHAERGNPPFYDEFGKRYYVRGSSDGYRERGTASWYGREFHGRPTSSGETYNMHAMTAAHPTLPIPTWVEVTNLSNGKRVVVKVNDRGPFVGERVIDLSHAAASALDMVRAGTAPVEIRALPGPPETTAGGPHNNRDTSPAKLDEPVSRPSPITEKARPVSPRPAPESPQPPIKRSPPATQSERLFAEAGRFSTREEAVELVDTLKTHGFANAFVVTEDRRRKSVHRVRVGPLLDATEFDRVSEQIRTLGAKRSQLVAMR
jgi:rare lipoprotein A